MSYVMTSVWNNIANVIETFSVQQPTHKCTEATTKKYSIYFFGSGQVGKPPNYQASYFYSHTESHPSAVQQPRPVTAVVTSRKLCSSWHRIPQATGPSPEMVATWNPGVELFFKQFLIFFALFQCTQRLNQLRWNSWISNESRFSPPLIPSINLNHSLLDHHFNQQTWFHINHPISLNFQCPKRDVTNFKTEITEALRACTYIYS